MITIMIGNIFESKATTLVNTVNCVGVMGKGIALEFKNKYPEMYKEYVHLCANNLVKPGVPYLYQDLFGTSIINFPTKDHWKSPSKLSYIVSGLKWIAENYKNSNITSLALPPLGCGNGGLTWELVGPIMYKMLKNLPIDIVIYAPYGTKTEYLTNEYLENNCINSNREILGNRSIHFNNKWLLIPYVVQELNKNRYSLAVGRTIFQKICYILTRSGVNTEFSFSKGSYGPYSPNVKDAITVLSNANLITEKQLGKMISVTTTPLFKLDKTKFSKNELDGAEKTIDLFSRIKRTDDAEMISTVIFSADELLKTNKSITELDVYNYVISWKPKWESEKGRDISETIRNLAMLKWLNVSPSNNLPHASEFEM